MEHDNVEIVRRAYSLGRDGVEQLIERYLDPAVEWETRWPGLEPWFHGHDGVREWVRQVVEPMGMDIELIDVRAIHDDVVLAKLRTFGRGRGSDVPAEMLLFDLLWLRDGRIHRRRTFYSEQEALAAA